MRRLACTIPFLLAASAAVAAEPATGGTASSDDAAFAEHLLRSGDPFNALTFYRRALFTDPDRTDAADLHLRIGLCYELGERYPAAEEAYLDTAGRFPGRSPEATYRAAMATAHVDPLRARIHLEEVVMEGEGTAWAMRASFMQGVVTVQAGDLDGADGAFATYLAAWPTSELSPRAEAARSLLAVTAPRRSPALAGTMSLVLPGSGQLYAGHPGDGLMAFLASGVLGAWSATLIWYGVDADRGWAVASGTVLGTFAVFSWASNVVGATRGARRFNRHQQRRRAEEILRELDHPDLQRIPTDVLSASD